MTELEDILQRFLDDLNTAFKNWEGKTVDVFEAINEFVHHVQFTLVGRTNNLVQDICIY